jgi:AcrR family transcriptional regulator
MVRLADDLTTLARIRTAALRGFAHDGVERTSVRRVAGEAGVSAGLVQHYFPSKADMRAAVDEHVAAVARHAFEGLAPSVEGEDVIDELGRRIAALVRDRPDELLYVARLVSEGDEHGLRLFDAFVEISRARWGALAREGLVHADTDLSWSALQSVVLNLGTVLFADAVSRHLPEPFRSDEGLERWRVATTDLFRRGVYEPRSS